MNLLLVDDDAEFRTFLKVSLKNTFPLKMAGTLAEAFVEIEKGNIDTLLLDVHLGQENSLNLLKALKEKNEKIDIVMVSGAKEPALIVECIRQGAQDYLVKPFDIEDLLVVLEKIKKNRSLREHHEALLEVMNAPAPGIVGQSKSWKDILSKAQRIKGHDTTILIEGESGTGKEVLAKHLHRQESSPQRPFIAVNCAAIPDHLLESELFGHEKGSFTGALSKKIGKFELAQNGDLFLDEVSSLSIDQQAKLLRALQEKEIVRVGGDEVIPVHFRLLAASNENLEKLVAQGKFRQDLYHRLRVIFIKIPPLRERISDIPLFIQYFLQKYDVSKRYSFTAEAIEILSLYSWPGNIRELENLVHSLIVLSIDVEIQPQHLPDWILGKNALESKQMQTNDWPQSPRSIDEVIPLHQFVGDVERSYIGHVLNLVSGDKSKAADILRMGRTSLYQRLKK